MPTNIVEKIIVAGYIENIYLAATAEGYTPVYDTMMDIIIAARMQVYFIS